MGKGIKRKNAGVGVDFRRVKHKVGKKLPKAENQTDTSFKARSIALPEQSVLADKSGAAVTSRNLTLKDLLGQCGHYSEKVRREALQGLAELLAAHPGELTRHTTVVMETLAARITDSERSVRAALREALASPVLPAMGAAALGPFVPLLMAHVCSATTHLADPIRADALGFLDLLADWRPDLIAAAFLAPVLSHFGDLLSKGSRGRSLSAGSLSALLRTVAALERLLQRLAVTAGSSGEEASAGRGAPPASGLAAPAGEGSGTAVLRLFCARCSWGPLALPGAGGAGGVLSLGAVSGGGSSTGGQGAAGGGQAAAEDAARQLLGHLLECWSDCGPSQLVQSPDLPLAQCLLAISQSCNLLLQRWGPALAGGPADKGSLAASLLKRVAPVFPLQRPAVPPPAPVTEALVQLNVSMAQLLARFLPAQLGPATAAAAGSAPAPAAEGSWVGRLLDWFEGVMQSDSGALPEAEGEGAGWFGAAPGEQERSEDEAAPAAAVASGKGSSKGVRKGQGKKGGAQQQQQQQGKQRLQGKQQKQQRRLQQALPAEVYAAALEGVLGVLPLVAGPRRRALLGAVWALWERSPVPSATRAQVLLFWRRLLADPAGSFYTPLPPSGEPLLFPSEALQWLQALPRFLWELGSTSTPTTDSALRLLLDGARFACCDPAALAALQQQLAPLFATMLPAGGGGRGKQGGARGAAAEATPPPQRVLPGPLCKQPQRVQSLAVDLLLHLPSLQESTLKTATLLCLTDAYPVATALRLLEVVAFKASTQEPALGCGQGSGLAGGAAAAVVAAEGGSGAALGGFGGMLLCLLSGCSQSGVELAQRGQEGWRRHEAVTRGACQVLLGCGCSGELAAAMAEPLLELCRSSRSARPLYGLLYTAAAVAEAPADVGADGAGLLPAALLPKLPGAMLCYAALCSAAAAAQPAAAAAPREGSNEAQQQQRATVQQGGAWLPPPEEALALSLRLLRAQPALLLPALDAIPASIAAVAPQSAAAAQAAGGGSILVGWLPQATTEQRQQEQQQPGVTAAGMAAAALQLLEGLLAAEGGLRHHLVESEACAACGEAALAACTATVAALEAQGHPAAPQLRTAAGRAAALLSNLLGKELS